MLGPGSGRAEGNQGLPLAGTGDQGIGLATGQLGVAAVGPMSEEEFQFFGESNTLDRDVLGRTVLRGLTFEETESYLRHWRQQVAGEEDRDGRRRFIDLHNRHLDALERWRRNS